MGQEFIWFAGWITNANVSVRGCEQASHARAGLTEGVDGPMLVPPLPCPGYTARRFSDGARPEEAVQSPQPDALLCACECPGVGRGSCLGQCLDSSEVHVASTRLARTVSPLIAMPGSCRVLEPDEAESLVPECCAASRPAVDARGQISVGP